MTPQPYYPSPWWGVTPPIVYPATPGTIVTITSGPDASTFTWTVRTSETSTGGL